MKMDLINRLEDLNVELACANDTLEVFDKFIGDGSETLEIGGVLVGDVIYSLWSHYKRISDSLGDVVDEMYAEQKVRHTIGN